MCVCCIYCEHWGNTPTLVGEKAVTWLHQPGSPTPTHIFSPSAPFLFFRGFCLCVCSYLNCCSTSSYLADGHLADVCLWKTSKSSWWPAALPLFSQCHRSPLYRLQCAFLVRLKAQDCTAVKSAAPRVLSLSCYEPSLHTLHSIAIMQTLLMGITHNSWHSNVKVRDGWRSGRTICTVHVRILINYIYNWILHYCNCRSCDKQSKLYDLYCIIYKAECICVHGISGYKQKKKCKNIDMLLQTCYSSPVL